MVTTIIDSVSNRDRCIAIALIKQPCRLIRHIFLTIFLISISLFVNADSLLFGGFEEDSIPIIDPNAERMHNRYLWGQYPSGVLSGEVVETGVASLTSADSVEGNQSLQIDVDQGAAYLQFYPYDIEHYQWFFLREYVENKMGFGPWQTNHFNRMEFYVKVPSTLKTATGGRSNLQIGTYNRCVDGCDRRSAEGSSGRGGHFYHKYNIPYTGVWQKIIWDMHPSHLRGQNGGLEHGFKPHPTGEANFNYFDTLTRFYVDFDHSLMENATLPSQWLFDGFRLYREDYAEEEDKVYGVSGVYQPYDRKLMVSWTRNKDDNNLSHEVRYAFKNIHEIGWENALIPPGNIVAPLGHQGYNTMWYETSDIIMEQHTSIFVAIKPHGEEFTLFKQIEIPLTTEVTASPPLPPTSIQVSIRH